MKLLITGGAGYIGSHVSRLLQSKGYEQIVIDDLSTGRLRALAPGIKFIEADFSDSQKLCSVFSQYDIQAVLHFAASIDVAESEVNPLKYYKNNFDKTRVLLETMVECKVSRLLFSSTACVYKNSKKPVQESDETEPTSAYGQSKLMCEWMIQNLAKSNSNFRYVILRYFNVAGAEPDLSNGQVNPRATHLIKRGVQAALKQVDRFQIYGNDYETHDGTAVRDFIHVKDLAKAHQLALEYLQKDGSNEIFNCGYKQGFSVKQVIDVIQNLADENFPVEVAPRRPGDIPQSIADNSKIRSILGWEPEFDNLKFICETAMNWEKHVLQNSKT